MNPNDSLSATGIGATTGMSLLLPYDVYDPNSHLTSVSVSGTSNAVSTSPVNAEMDGFPEEGGKYDLDTVSVFVAKLYQLLDSDEYKEYLTWNDTGDVFVICNMDEFAANVLPKFFKHCKFTSFVRQLNIYGFYRVSDARKSKHVRSKHACVFSHPQFRRNRQDLLTNIKRKVSKPNKKRARPTESSSSSVVGNNNNSMVTSPVDGYETAASTGLKRGFPDDKSDNNNSTSTSPVDATINRFLVRASSDAGKDYIPGDGGSNNHHHSSEADFLMHDKIAKLTATTDNLRQEMKDMSNFVADRLLPEVKRLADDLSKHQSHLVALTQLVTASYPDGNALLENALRNFHNQHGFSTTDASSNYIIPSRKRIRIDTNMDTAAANVDISSGSGATIKNEHTIGTTSIPYGGLYPNNSHYSKNQGHHTHEPITSTTVPSSITIASSPHDSHPHHSHNFGSFAGSLMTTGYHPQNNPTSPSTSVPTSASTGFNDSWNTPTATVMIQDPIANSSKINDANNNNNSRGNSPHNQSNHHRDDIIGAPSPHSPDASPPSGNNSLTSIYSQTSILPMNMYGASFGTY
ncbi:6786_t:CDS:2 [Ambispora leptoticha]|uniref:6786_t:CDS:1 n=1 Tax=Ambispora leptoticha TaxID=144679 RepID=A0A9N8WMS6_9GLOM|nr:6786_t:CDS:2 [Ambispora leptoticha]